MANSSEPRFAAFETRFAIVANAVDDKTGLLQSLRRFAVKSSKESRSKPTPKPGDGDDGGKLDWVRLDGGGCAELPVDIGELERGSAA